VKRQRKAYSLLEMVAVVGLVGTMAGMAGLSFRKLKSRAGTQGLATIVVEEIRRARQEAVTHGRPVAFVIPKGPDSFSRSYYAVEGESCPHITRTNSFSQEFNGAGLFVGDWTSAASSAGLPAPRASKWTNFNVANWIASQSGHSGIGGANDFYFVFLPDGSVRTNSLPAFDNSYHVVVAGGVTTSGTTLSAASEPFTISISPIGGITVDGGIPKGSSVATPPALSNANVPLAPAQVSRPLGTITPAVDPKTGVDYPTITPKPGPVTGALKAYVKVGEFLTFDMGTASDEGEELFGQYMITVKVGNTTPKPGAFSMRGTNGTLVEVDSADPRVPQAGSRNWVADGGRLEWNQTESCWRSTWQWTPPPDAQPGDEFTLQPLVQNTPTGLPQPVGIPQVIRVQPPGSVLFQTDRSGAQDVYSMTLRGHNQKLLKAGASQPTATLNGSRLAWVRGNNIEMSFREAATRGYVLNDTALPACDIPALSPLGNYIAFRRSGRIIVMNTIRETDAANLVVDVGPSQMPDGVTVKSGTEKMSWSSDGLSLFYVDDAHRVVEQKFTPKSVKPVRIGGPTPVAGMSGADSFGGRPWCAPSCGIDGTMFVMSNWNNPNYDPWFWRFNGGAGWYHKTVTDEEVTPERNPNGGMRVLEGWRNSPANKFVIRLSDNAGPTAQNAVFVDDLTVPADGNCLYPVWTDP
jgi:type II secretory pathway pseudopilin PulG